ncbi:hypothetical protein CYK21_00345 [Streptococcus macedonicus]|uniref:Uncharacterized protein n=2 Tax=Streptococcus TaxID=1301 RepID=E0PCB6_STREI|nr:MULTISPECIES: hypothetical protein [Streptococcus]EFM28045.1 hypothetical protein HMPREF9319_0489 [Streptococcus equinus ATCC 700338]MDU7209918.1 hypothetical protein [Streptococcus sp.]RGB45471.1 hypothetical protein DW662_05085 [Streptococcus gallolyticus]MDU7847001.1 hypothetical protein [Streptococcus sp.]PLA54606.1 hypothetical protein CYK21_00345 [Streptococcus macedonicus]
MTGSSHFASQNCDKPSQLCGGGTTNYEYWDSVPLPQNLRVAGFIDVAVTFTTAVSIVLLLALLANNPKIEQRQ